MMPLLVAGIVIVLALGLWFLTEYLLKRYTKKPKKRRRRKR